MRGTRGSGAAPDAGAAAGAGKGLRAGTAPGAGAAASGPAAGAAFTGRDAAILTGCVPFWLCPRAASLLLTGYQAGPAALEPRAMLAWYGVFALAVVAASALAFKLPRAALSRPCLAATGVGGCLAVAALSSGSLSGAALGAALVLMAAFAVAHLNGVAQVLVREPLPKVALYVTASGALVNGLRAALGGLDAGLFPAARAAMPLLSAAFLVAMRPSFASATGMAARASGVGPLSSLAKVAWPVVLACAVLIALWSFTVGTLSQNRNWMLDSDQRRLSYLLTFLLLVAVSAVLAAPIARRRPASAPSSVPYLFCAIVLLYMAVLLGMAVTPQGDFVLFKQVLIGIEQCLEVLLLALILADVARQRLPSQPVLAVCIVALTNAPWLIASNVVTTSFGPAAEALEKLPVVLSFVTAAVLVACLLASIRRIEARPAAEARDAQRALCEQVAEAYGLSDKELEVLNLLYRGNSAKRIAEVLGVTGSTVHSHTNSIYRKLGIHSRQEAIDLVDGRRAGA